MIGSGTIGALAGVAAVEMHQIRYFLAVCETLNFTRAAEACNVSQPSLTRAIKRLEDELRGPLFRRERNPKVGLIVQDGSHRGLKDRLARGGLVVAVYGQPGATEERFHAGRLYDERFVIGVGPGHAFDKQKAARVADPHDQAYVNRL